MHSINYNPSDINQTFIIEPIIFNGSGSTPIVSACTAVFTNYIQNCDGNASVFLNNGTFIFSGDSFFNNGISAQTISGNTFYSGILNANTGNINVINTSTLNATGGTITTLSSTTINATNLYLNGALKSYNGLTNLTNLFLSGTTGGFVLAPIALITGAGADTFVTRFTYLNNVFTLTNSTGGTLTALFNTVTGLTVNGNLTVTGNTVLNSISATTYLGLPTDIRVTGGTLSAGTTTFTNNTGGTFSVSGFVSADTFVTGFTYLNNVFTLTNSTGGTFSTLFNTVTGLTVNGNLTVTGNTLSNSLSATTISASSFNDEIQVRSLSDLPIPVLSGITLASGVTYRIKGSVNLGDNYISTSTSNTIYGVDKSSDKLIYTGPGGMIRSTNQDLTVRFITMVALAGQTFDLTLGSTNNCQISDCIFGSNLSIGTLTGGRFVTIDRNLFSENSGGLTINNSPNYFTYTDNILVSNTGTSLTIVIGTSTLILVSRCNFDIPTGQTGITISTGVTVNNGSITNNSFNGLGTQTTGVNRLSPNWTFADNTSPITINKVPSPIFIPRSSDGSWIRFRASNITVSATGAGGTQSGTASVGNDNITNYTTYTTAATIAALGGIRTSVFTEFRVNHNPTFECVIETGASLLTQRIWVGLFSAAVGNSDDQTGAYIGFRYSSVASDTGWLPIVDNGTVNTVGTRIGTVDVNTQYRFKIMVDFPRGRCYFSVNESPWQVINATPNSGQSLGVAAQVVVTFATAQTIKFSRFDLIHD